MAEDEKVRPEETAAEAEMRFIEAGSLDMENRDPKNLNSHIAVSETSVNLFLSYSGVKIAAYRISYKEERNSVVI